jgi:uncharacterized spore protein YtfJ
MRRAAFGELRSPVFHGNASVASRDSPQHHEREVEVAERPDIREVVERLRAAATDARESMRAQAAFGEPVTHNGLTVLPAASVRGGFGGGGGAGGGPGGEAGDGEGSGMGMGYGLTSRPIGAYVISDDDVQWKPAIDPTRMFLAGCLVMVALFFFVWLGR